MCHGQKLKEILRKWCQVNDFYIIKCHNHYNKLSTHSVGWGEVYLTFHIFYPLFYIFMSLLFVILGMGLGVVGVLALSLIFWCYVLSSIFTINEMVWFLTVRRCLQWCLNLHDLKFLLQILQFILNIRIQIVLVGVIVGCLQLLFDLRDETPIKIHIEKVLI